MFSVLSTMVISGCASTNEVNAGPQYPEGLARIEPLNIHAFRSGTRLQLTNTTGVSFGPGMLWLNGRYGREIDGLAVGQTLRVPLGGFIDEQGRRFGAGGFFAAERPELLALVEMTTSEARLDGEGERAVKYGLIVVGQRR